MPKLISKLIAARVKEIREWRSAYREFKITPDNVKQHERQQTEMIEMIDDLLDAVEQLRDPK